MTQIGKMSSIYIQERLVHAIDVAVANDRDRFKSRNQFIQSAIHKRLRELDLLPKEGDVIW